MEKTFGKKLFIYSVSIYLQLLKKRSAFILTQTIIHQLRLTHLDIFDRINMVKKCLVAELLYLTFSF